MAALTRAVTANNYSIYCNTIKKEKPMSTANLTSVSLKPYLWRFFWMYIGGLLLASAVLVVMNIFINIGHTVPGLAIDWIVLNVMTVSISKRFATHNQRFFTTDELKRMVFYTTLWTSLFQ